MAEKEENVIQLLPRPVFPHGHLLILLFNTFLAYQRNFLRSTINNWKDDSTLVQLTIVKSIFFFHKPFQTPITTTCGSLSEWNWKVELPGVDSFKLLWCLKGNVKRQLETYVPLSRGAWNKDTAWGSPVGSCSLAGLILYKSITGMALSLRSWHNSACGSWTVL